jgi:SAM-dependent methyltransferase
MFGFPASAYEKTATKSRKRTIDTTLFIRFSELGFENSLHHIIEFSATKRYMKKLSANTADKFNLYLQSVQTPWADARFLSRRYKNITGKPLRFLREDFCGTANLLCEFIRLNKNNRGIGVDLDLKPLRWCRTNNFPKLEKGQQNRIELLHKDAILVRCEPADMVVALNYSYCVLKTRSLLLQYLKNARRGLRPGGVFILDAQGGSAVPIEDQEVWDIDGFQYVWDVSQFDPVTHRIICKIHFLFHDQTMMRNAFVYDWRLWTLPELQELFHAAGFQDIHVLWEGTDPKTNLGNGRLRRVRKGRAEGAWYAMVVGRNL